MSLGLCGIALGLKRFDIDRGFWRLFLFAPVLYMLTEIIENVMLAAMVYGVIPDSGLTALLQQTATTGKLLTDGVSSVALAFAILASFGALLTTPFRRKKGSGDNA
jgi:hypothetical protein